MRATERAVVESDSGKRRRDLGLDIDVYAPENSEAEQVSIPKLLVNFKLRTAYEKGGHTRADKRMKNMELSESNSCPRLRRRPRCRQRAAPDRAPR